MSSDICLSPSEVYDVVDLFCVLLLVTVPSYLRHSDHDLSSILHYTSRGSVRGIVPSLLLFDNERSVNTLSLFEQTHASIFLVTLTILTLHPPVQ